MTNTVGDPTLNNDLFGSLSSSIRSDLLHQCQISFSRLAQAGTWWSGAERIEIANEVRRASSCLICAARKKALSPYAVKDRHPGNGILPSIVVDTIHRVVSDSGRLTGDWYQELSLNGLAGGKFVELISTVATVFSIDRLAKGIGAPTPPLPVPQPGNPTRIEPAGASTTFARVPTVPFEAAEGNLKAHYQKAADANGNMPHIQQALSFVPDEQIAVANLSSVMYLPTADVIHSEKSVQRAISIPQMEWVATLVSSANDCYY